MTTVLDAAGTAGLLVGSAVPGPGSRGGLALHRLPSWARAQHDDVLLGWAERCPAGSRLRFVTAAGSVCLTMVTTTVRLVDDLLARPSRLAVQGDRDDVADLAVVDLPVGDVVLLGPDMVPAGYERREPTTVEIDLTARSCLDDPVEVWLPHDCAVELVSLTAAQPVHACPDSRPRWVHYGSSISQGLEAPSPDRRWPAQVALTHGWSLHDLSFSGNAQLDPFAARMIRDTPADLVTLKVGINLVNADSMRRRAMLPALHGFLDTIREGCPATPVVVVTALACPIHESAPGPVVTDPVTGRARAARRDVESDAGALTLTETRAVVEDVVAARRPSDPHLFLVDGLTLFETADSTLLHDDLHPSADGLDLVATRFSDALRALATVGPALVPAHPTGTTPEA